MMKLMKLDYYALMPVASGETTCEKRVKCDIIVIINAVNDYARIVV